MTGSTVDIPDHLVPAETSPAAALWLVQAVSGLLLVALLALHMVAHHFVVEGGLREFRDVVAYISNPAIFWIEIIFLFVVTVHALLGLRAIGLDLAPGPTGRRVMDVALSLAGAGTLVYGIWLLITLRQM